MCGIAGIISSDTSNVSKESLRKMTDTLQHRGPEGDGFWINKKGTVGLGHRRLSIIDLSPAGSQPMHYLDRITITYNGEIYNYIEVKETLEKKGYAFASHCDTEVILAAYACYGKECLQHFDGMFAFAIWDDEKQTLFCARDRFGEKPFYYTEHNGRFLFASEMKALWAVGAGKEMQPGMLLNYLTLGFTSNTFHPFETFYKDINSLTAAHYLELTFNGDRKKSDYTIRVQSYWDIDKETTIDIRRNAATEQFMHLFQTSVKRRLRSDVPIGTSLSGGLDSSSIVAVAQQFLQSANKYKQASFSAVFPGFDKDESKQVKKVVKHFNLNTHVVTPTANELIKDLEKLAYHQEEPFESTSIYAQYKVYELAEQNGVTVLLDGQGADETMAGYHKYYQWYWQELFANGERRLSADERTKARSIGVMADWNWKNYLSVYLPSYAARYLEKSAEREQVSLPGINYDFFSKSERYGIYKPVVEKLNDILYFNTVQLGLNGLLRYADRNSMAHSREVRLPFLSHELVEFIFSLPASFKINEGFTKWILRQSVKDILPAEITWRHDKVGFEPPQAHWMQSGTMKDYLYESRKKLVDKGILKKGILTELIRSSDAYDRTNYDWRFLSAAQCL
jgi:asparagine synthase (glutamine-hydrolysing)